MTTVNTPVENAARHMHAADKHKRVEGAPGWDGATLHAKSRYRRDARNILNAAFADHDDTLNREAVARTICEALGHKWDPLVVDTNRLLAAADDVIALSRAAGVTGARSRS